MIAMTSLLALIALAGLWPVHPLWGIVTAVALFAMAFDAGARA